MSRDLRNIRSALIAAYVDGGFGLPTGYEGQTFEPPNNAPWMKVFNLPASSPPSTLGAGGYDEHVGVMQIDINVPINTGTDLIMEKADAVRAQFKAGRRFYFAPTFVFADGSNLLVVNDGDSLSALAGAGEVQCVRVTRCDVARIRTEGAWNRIPLSVYWVANTIR